MLLSLHIRDLRDQLGRDDLTHKHMGACQPAQPHPGGRTSPRSPWNSLFWAGWAEATFL